MTMIRTVLACACVAACAAPPQPTTCTFTAETGLPDSLLKQDGTCIGRADEWPSRRAELLELFASTTYGRSPDRPEQLEFVVTQRDPTAMQGAATLKRVDVISQHQGRRHVFELLLFTPNRVPRAGVFLLLSTRPARHTDPSRAERSEYWPAETAIERGYGIAAIDTDRVAPDDRDTFKQGVIELFEGPRTQRPKDAWKTIAAWSWGARRVMDYLETDPQVDARRVVIVGHSRGGKAARKTTGPTRNESSRASRMRRRSTPCSVTRRSHRPNGRGSTKPSARFPAATTCAPVITI